MTPRNSTEKAEWKLSGLWLTFHDHSSVHSSLHQVPFSSSNAALYGSRSAIVQESAYNEKEWSVLGPNPQVFCTSILGLNPTPNREVTDTVHRRSPGSHLVLALALTSPALPATKMVASTTTQGKTWPLLTSDTAVLLKPLGRCRLHSDALPQGHPSGLGEITVSPNFMETEQDKPNKNTEEFVLIERRQNTWRLKKNKKFTWWIQIISSKNANQLENRGIHWKYLKGSRKC